MEKKVAIVTGGTKGIGLATCKALAKDGYKVFCGARNPVNEDLFGDKNISFHVLDVSNVKSCSDFVNFVLTYNGSINVLVNNAGITRDKMTEKMTDEMFDSVISINEKGPFNMVRIIGPIMQKVGKGSIINLSSISGEYGNMGQCNYSASKAALIAMTKCWAREFSRHGEQVRVNAIAPGFIDTEMLSTIPLDILSKMKELTFLKRLGTVDEVANLVVFLASDMSSYITGATIDINGGLRL
jgi:3-oxoacyl-[acyl-carrier protein] reductase